MRRWLLVLAILALLSGLAVTASAAEPLTATVTGPTAVAPGQSVFYNVTMGGGPTVNVTYSVTYYITGTNTTGGTPLAASPGKVRGNETTLRFNITAPTKEQTLTLVLTVDATPRGGTLENVTTSYAITVIKAIVLSATFHNGASTAAMNVTVRWYVDNGLVGTSVIKQVTANGDATVSFNYLPVNLAGGQHTVRVEADLDHDGIIDPARGEVVTSTIFYAQVQPPSTGWTILLGIGVFVPVLMAVVALRRRGQR